MKVIFLDFDGVINDWESFNEVNIKNVLNLKKIVESTNAKIVVTSSTKYSFQRPNSNIKREDTTCYKYIRVLNYLGIQIYDFTPYIGGNREKEIIEYLKMNEEIEEYLILDDDYVIDSLKEHEVFIDLNKGICDEHIIPSINILNGCLGFYPPNYDKLDAEQNIIRINEHYRDKEENNQKSI